MSCSAAVMLLDSATCLHLANNPCFLPMLLFSTCQEFSCFVLISQLLVHSQNKDTKNNREFLKNRQPLKINATLDVPTELVSLKQIGFSKSEPTVLVRGTTNARRQNDKQKTVHLSVNNSKCNCNSAVTEKDFLFYLLHCVNRSQK